MCFFLVYLVSFFFFCIFGVFFLLVISVLTVAPKCSAKMLLSVSQCKETVRCLMEKVCIGKFCSGMS